jgi:MFS superfamily sulfate permease-like transporter
MLCLVKAVSIPTSRISGAAMKSRQLERPVEQTKELKMSKTAERDQSRTPSTAAGEETILQRLRFYLWPLDGRYEDLLKPPRALNVLRDFTAGLIVAMVAIPLAMGLAMASGLPPEMGIVGGAIAGLVGALFGGSKYQVYGPTAAFIPVIAAITSKYDGYDFLIWCSIISGVVLIVMGLARLGRIVALVPNSIVVGFTIGIAVVIAMSQVEQVLGLKAKLEYGMLAKLKGIAQYAYQVNVYAIAIAALTFVVTKLLLKMSRYAPAPLIALGAATLLASTIWADKGLSLIRDKYGPIPDDLLQVTLPGAIELTPTVLWDMCYFVVAIVFVSGVESLLCSRMADRLADNRGIPYNPNKELWGQGWVQILVVLCNGFPHTGALARTATNIKVGAVSPLAGVFKFGLKLMLAIFLARWLEIVPMACIGGILMFVAVNMFKPAEVKEVWRHNRFHAGLMAYTAVMVAVTDFLIGVLSALALYGVLHRFMDRPSANTASESDAIGAPHINGQTKVEEINAA